ncbi:hypothetical protein FJ366_03315 [Candidatus Dependentiae bacterium]|nr:hypothetical protein [Candidatus Dependentiae bacterium]
MIVIESSIATKAKPSVIWNRLIDVVSWKEWVVRLVSSKLTGGFKVGSSGQLNMGVDRVAHFVIKRVEPDRMFVLSSQSWGNEVVFSYIISFVGGMQRMTIRVEVVGWTSWIFGLWFRFILKKELPASLTRLAFLVEEDQDRVERELHSAHFK